TYATGIDGNNIVGYYYNSVASKYEGFLYNGSSYTSLVDPSAVGGTYALGISGSNIVGYYVNGSGLDQAFLYNGSTYTDISFPASIEDLAFGIDGGNIVGFYVPSSV